MEGSTVAREDKMPGLSQNYYLSGRGPKETGMSRLPDYQV